MKLLAISARVVAETRYPEERDAVARDWWRFLRVALPEYLPIILPNEMGYARALVTLPEVTGLLLTGGDDVGACPARDEAEAAALAVARTRGLPTLGVCRGMQLIASLHGARIVSVSTALHVAARHPVEADLPGSPRLREVNSFHGKGVDLSPGSSLCVRARGPDGSVEAIELPGCDAWGILWHPEREAVADAADIALFAHLFGGQRATAG